MTAREMQEAIGKPVFYDADALQFACWVKDVKIGYGQPRFLIAPMAGTGERWVEFSSIRPMPDQQKTLTSMKESSILKLR
jgi:hypothetical protein